MPEGREGVTIVTVVASQDKLMIHEFPGNISSERGPAVKTGFTSSVTIVTTVTGFSTQGADHAY